MSCEESNKKMAWKVGPFGELEKRANYFDDGVHSAVKQLVITYSKGIRSIQIEYDDNGSSIWSKHGSKYSNKKEEKIKLDYPDEFFTSVYGCYNTFWNPDYIISSLTFKSNKKSYGPYGLGGGKKHFSIEVPAGSKIVGFHGCTNAFGSLRAIGAHLKPIEHYQNDKCHPSKPLDHISSSMVPTVRDPSKLILPPEYPCHTKVINEDNDKANKQISCIISGNQVSGSEGSHNGTFAVANKYKYITYYYYKVNLNAM